MLSSSPEEENSKTSSHGLISGECTEEMLGSQDGSESCLWSPVDESPEEDEEESCFIVDRGGEEESESLFTRRMISSMVVGSCLGGVLSGRT